jgi:hypothetical protein
MSRTSKKNPLSTLRIFIANPERCVDSIALRDKCLLNACGSNPKPKPLPSSPYARHCPRSSPLRLKLATKNVRSLRFIDSLPC